MNCCNANGQCGGGPDCPVRPGQEMPMPKVYAPARQHKPCDQLGVCNCSGQHCEFELPDLGPMTLAERLLVCVICILSVVSMLGLIGWLVQTYGPAIVNTASMLLWTAATLYS